MYNRRRSDHFEQCLQRGEINLSRENISCQDFERILRKLSNGREGRPRKCRKLDGIDGIIAKLPPSTPVNSMVLHGNRQIGNTTGMALLYFLLPESVRRFNVAHCGLESEGIKVLCEYLKTNTSITQLLVFGNSFGDEGAKHIADMLRANKSLQELAVSDCMIGPKGFSYLADALAVNNTLHELNLYLDLNFRDDYIRTLCQGLKANRGIETLDIRITRVSPEGINHIVDCLRSNHYLKYICVGPSLDLHPAWSEVAFLLELNKFNRKIVNDEEATLSDWLETVIKASQKEDVGYSYYFLRNKPELCMYSQSTDA
jgi:hypothetical protein